MKEFNILDNLFLEYDMCDIMSYTESFIDTDSLFFFEADTTNSQKTSILSKIIEFIKSICRKIRDKVIELIGRLKGDKVQVPADFESKVVEAEQTNKGLKQIVSAAKAGQASWFERVMSFMQDHPKIAAATSVTAVSVAYVYLNRSKFKSLLDRSNNAQQDTVKQLEELNKHVRDEKHQNEVKKMSEGIGKNMKAFYEDIGKCRESLDAARDAGIKAKEHEQEFLDKQQNKEEYNDYMMKLNKKEYDKLTKSIDELRRELTRKGIKFPVKKIDYNPFEFDAEKMADRVNELRNFENTLFALSQSK